jgi:hypothetical protein
MDTPNWGLQDWGTNTMYEPQGAFFKRDLQGGMAGPTQGAFNAMGAGLKGAGQAMMMPQGRPAGEMAMMGLAQGSQNAMRMREKQMQPQGQGGGLQPGGPMSGIGLLKGLFGGQGGGQPQQPQQPMGAFKFPWMGGGQ